MSPNPMRSLPLVLGAALLASCVAASEMNSRGDMPGGSPLRRRQQRAAQPAMAEVQTAEAEPLSRTPRTEWPTKSTLYGRDGRPVDSSAGTGFEADPSAAPGMAAAAPAQPAQSGAVPAHDVRPGEAGRMYILELYQKVIEERDALSLEVSLLDQALAKAQDAIGEADRRITELETKVGMLEQDKAALLGQNMDLASRLTTAQIRRLQAEKILLEARLEEQRALESTARGEPPQEPRKP